MTKQISDHVVRHNTPTAVLTRLQDGAAPPRLHTPDLITIRCSKHKRGIHHLWLALVLQDWLLKGA